MKAIDTTTNKADKNPSYFRFFINGNNICSVPRIHKVDYLRWTCHQSFCRTYDIRHA